MRHEYSMKHVCVVILQAAQALADPVEYPNMFDDLPWALKVKGLATTLLRNN